MTEKVSSLRDQPDNRWSDEISSLDRRLVQEDDSVRAHLDAIYLLLDALVYGRYSTDRERELIQSALVRIYRDANNRFSDRADYLFFAGYLVGISYWLFEEDNLDESRLKMRRALALDPKNPIYQWGQAFANNDSESPRLAATISSDQKVQHWLKSYGPPGQYVSEIVREHASTKGRI
jgi:hypothetical protein